MLTRIAGGRGKGQMITPQYYFAALRGACPLGVDEGSGHEFPPILIYRLLSTEVFIRSVAGNAYHGGNLFSSQSVL